MNTPVGRELAISRNHGVMSYDLLAETIAGRPAARGLRCRIVAVDGYSGAGKSFVARNLAAALGAEVINTDDLIPGWSGLADSLSLLAHWILEPLTDGAAARWQYFDWDRLRYTHWVDVAACPTLVVEGCGVGHRDLSFYVSFLVWVSAPAAVRQRRLHRRADWQMYEAHAENWARQERALRHGDGVEVRADVIIDNSAWGPESTEGALDPSHEFSYRRRRTRTSGRSRSAG